MKHTIKKMEHVLSFLNEDRKPVTMNGYAFIDESGRCYMIVYGEGRRDFLSNYLNNLPK
jgi:hypothetical protein